jgi:DNA-binding transcriptional LysR family regulator
MDQLETMRTFVRVAELGSFAEAARQLGVARSVVTRQVSALERRLGAKLMTRSTRKLALTSAGAGYLARSRVILNLVEAAETDIAAERAVPRGRIRIGLPLSYGLRRLTPLLLEFAASQPEISLEMDYTDRHLNLIEEGFDLSIRVTSRLAPGDVARRLGSCRMMVVASPDYLARRGRPAHPGELASHECLSYLGGPSPLSWRFEVEGEFRSFDIKSRVAANNGEALVEAAARGLGLTLEPDFIAEEWLASRRVAQVLEEFRTPELGVYALMPSGTHIPYRVRALLDFLASRLVVDKAARGAKASKGRNT